MATARPLLLSDLLGGRRRRYRRSAMMPPAVVVAYFRCLLLLLLLPPAAHRCQRGAALLLRPPALPLLVPFPATGATTDDGPDTVGGVGGRHAFGRRVAQSIAVAEWRFIGRTLSLWCRRRSAGTVGEIVPANKDKCDDPPRSSSTCASLRPVTLGFEDAAKPSAPLNVDDVEGSH
jgi:hypothetical protein